MATYTCDTGYTLNGGTTTRTCGSDGVWSGSAAVCQRELFIFVECIFTISALFFVECIISYTVNCPDLPFLANGMIMYSAGSPGNRPFFSRAVHSCNPGYTLTGGTFSGGSTRNCVGGTVWSGSAPTCQREWNRLCTVCFECIVSITVNCPDLPTLTNGMIMYSAGSTDNRPFLTRAVYSCNTDYTLTGGTTRTCTNGGSWTGLPSTCLGEFCNSCVQLVFVSIIIRSLVSHRHVK